MLLLCFRRELCREKRLQPPDDWILLLLKLQGKRVRLRWGVSVVVAPTIYGLLMGIFSACPPGSEASTNPNDMMLNNWRPG